MVRARAARHTPSLPGCPLRGGDKSAGKGLSSPVAHSSGMVRWTCLVMVSTERESHVGDAGRPHPHHTERSRLPALHHLVRPSTPYPPWTCPPGRRPRPPARTPVRPPAVQADAEASTVHPSAARSPAPQPPAPQPPAPQPPVLQEPAPAPHDPAPGLQEPFRSGALRPGALRPGSRHPRGSGARVRRSRRRPGACRRGRPAAGGGRRPDHDAGGVTPSTRRPRSTPCARSA